MTQAAQIFLQNVTLIDAAYLDRDGVAHGVSYNPVFIVTGGMADAEQVVADFSFIKSKIKALIDHPETGFDHKLWVDMNYIDRISRIELNGIPHLKLGRGTTELLVPRNAICGFTDVETQEGLEFVLTHYLNSHLKVPGVTVQVRVPTPMPDLTAPGLEQQANPSLEMCAYPFRYTHGLPNSSSWGCQNILHGHESWVALVYDKPRPNQFPEDLCERMAALLNGKYIYDSSIRQADGSYQYETPRGKFVLHSSGNSWALPAAPTVENITKYLVGVFANPLEALDVRAVYVSEGLWKGSRIERPAHGWTPLLPEQVAN